MIRKAIPQDAPRINELLLQVQKVHSDIRPDLFVAGGKKYTDDQLAELIRQSEDSPIFVWTDANNMICGYAFCQYVITEGNCQLHPRKSLYIDDLCVDAASRRMHVATDLYAFVVEEAKRQGCNSITLNVWEGNDGARQFYEKSGMVPLKTTMEKIL